MINTLEFILNKYNIKELEPQILLDEDRWKSLPNLFNELQFTLGAEIGVERGLYSKRICRMNPQLKLYGVDCWSLIEGYREHVPQERLDAFYQETKDRMSPYNYCIIRDWSIKAAKKFPDEYFDFVYIDASHDYINATKDINTWSKKVRKGGIVVGHDYIEGCGVVQAIKEWVDTNKIEPLFIFNKERVASWLYVK